MADINYVQESKRPCPTGSPGLRAARPVHRLGPGNRLRSSLLNRLVKAGFTRWQTPLGGGVIRFKVRLVCGHPPKSGSGHGRRMRRPLRFRCAAVTSYPAAVGGGERGCDTTSLTGWPKGPMIASSEDSAAGESFISLTS